MNMKEAASIRRRLRLIWILITIGLMVGSCSRQETTAPTPSPNIPFDWENSSPSPVNLVDMYTVRIGADPLLYLPGRRGELRVWIGLPQFVPVFPDDFVTDETMIVAEGNSAQIEAYAPDFDVIPAQTQCLRISPRGSSVRFALTPRREGQFVVSADILLFDSDDCSGAAMPTAVDRLEVRVRVAPWHTRLGQFAEVFWEKLLEFWAAALALVSGLLLFLLRKQIKRRFGYDDKDS